MVLGFMQKFPSGEPTNFRSKILASIGLETCFYPKLHTIRSGERFKVGMSLQMALNVRTKNYLQFNKNIPALCEVRGVQRIDILHRGPKCVIIFIDRKVFYSRYAEGCWDREHNREKFDQFWKNDGFDSYEAFFNYFSKPVRRGQIIHWTDLKY